MFSFVSIPDVDVNASPVAHDERLKKHTYCDSRTPTLWKHCPSGAGRSPRAATPSLHRMPSLQAFKKLETLEREVFFTEGDGLGLGLWGGLLSEPPHAHLQPLPCTDLHLLNPLQLSLPEPPLDNSLRMLHRELTYSDLIS